MKRGNVRKFHRDKDQRAALLKSLATGLIEHGRIETTVTKAKELRPVAEKLVTRAKTNSIHSRRMLSRQLGVKAVKTLVDTVAPRFAERPGGYTRIVKMGTRASDGTQMVIIEFVA